MRETPTLAEKRLWAGLRKRQLHELKFRRQHIIDRFIVDFYCPGAKLVIEVDGGVHNTQKEYDQERDRLLYDLGYHVVRFKNSEIENNLDAVLSTIQELCTQERD